jgi:CBS domain-containing protein
MDARPAATRTGDTPLDPDDALQDAISIMVRHQLWHLPVALDDEPVGTLYLADVLALRTAPDRHTLPHITAQAGAQAPHERVACGFAGCRPQHSPTTPRVARVIRGGQFSSLKRHPNSDDCCALGARRVSGARRHRRVAGTVDQVVGAAAGVPLPQPEHTSGHRRTGLEPERPHGHRTGQRGHQLRRIVRLPPCRRCSELRGGW